ncbi:cell surface glycoprotein 1-like [Salvia splendens]|uniref:cell surface glycoprotein 1-like n=1 Tax=Salvia splendens TaxID=180675 RepID=UPI001C273E10|nr:cell surface glycoprotein 1-like [Salvia splendens]
MPPMSAPISAIPVTFFPPTTVPTPSIPTPSEPSQQETAPSETPKQPQTKPLDVSPLSAYQDLGTEEEIAEGQRIPEEKESEMEREFQSILDGVTGRKESAVEMAEGPDLASKAVGDSNTPESTWKLEGESAQPVLVDTEPKVPVVQHEAEKPTVIKSKVVKRKLVLKDNPKDERQKPKRVSQRCLGRGLTRKAGANTASETVTISSDEEGVTPTKPEEKPMPAADQEDTLEKAEVVPPTPTSQKVGTPTKPREDPSDTPLDKSVINTQATEPTAQEKPSASTEKKPAEETEEERYLQERKRKGKAHSRREEISDEDYTSNDEPDPEDDVSLEDEEFREQPLPNDHSELVHPPVERVEYVSWQIDLDDDLMEDTKHYNTTKLQDSFDDKEDNSKQIKCGKSSRGVNRGEQGSACRVGKADRRDGEYSRGLARRRRKSESGTISQETKRDVPQEPAEDDEDHQESEDDGSDDQETVPKEAPALNSALRRSRRNK